METLLSVLPILTPAETLPQCTVQLRKRGVTIPAGQISEIKYRVRAWPQRRTAGFEPSPESTYPEGIEPFPTLVGLPNGSSKIAKISIQNFTRHDLYLSHRTVLGTLEEMTRVKLVTHPSDHPQPMNRQSGQACSAQLSTNSQSTRTREKWHHL